MDAWGSCSVLLWLQAVCIESFHQRLASFCGKHYIRLDCWADNAALCAYYRRTGFVFCGSYKEGD